MSWTSQRNGETMAQWQNREAARARELGPFNSNYSSPATTAREEWRKPDPMATNHRTDQGT